MGNLHQPSGDRAPSANRGIAAMTRRSLLTGSLAAAAGVGVFRWLESRPPDNDLPWPFRRSLEAEEWLSQQYFRPARLASEFSRGSASMPKVNGTIGMDDDDFDVSQWALEVDGLEARSRVLRLSLDSIRALPKIEFVTELKCIEGWSTPVRWGGARLSDFARQYPPQSAARGTYVALATPDGAYYVALDMASALHPQTLLCYEMNGQPLTIEHGAPLRLVVPIKYGIKNLKRIGRISFTRTRPPDYWAERGYDYYAGF